MRKNEVIIAPYPRQEALLDSLAQENLFGGASEGGKSVAERFCASIWCDLIPGLQVEIYRKFYKDVVKNHMTGELNFKVLLRPWVEDGTVEITENQVRWKKTGSLITLGQLRTEEDAEKAQGNAKHVLILDEATQIPQKHITAVRGWVRMSNDMREMLPVWLKDLYPDYTPEQIMGMFPRIIYGCNPIGTSVGYFRRGFVLPHPVGTVFRAPDDDGGFTRCYLPSRIADNPNADPEAQRRRLSGFGSKVSKALIEGDWTAPGGDYFPEWNENGSETRVGHVIADCKLPAHWFRFRILDTGYAEPFFVLWLAVSDGEEFVDEHGDKRWFPRGSLIGYREWNGCDPEKPDKGLRYRNKDIAAGVLSRTTEPHSNITLTDSLPFQDRGMGENTNKRRIADEFKDAGVELTKANTARIHGWSMMRDRLIGIEVGPGFFVPTLFVMESLGHSREYIPALTHHEINLEDAQDKGEATHCCDTWRYGCTALPYVQDAPTDLANSAEQNTLTVVGALKEHQRKKSERGKKFY